MHDGEAEIDAAGDAPAPTSGSSAKIAPPAASTRSRPGAEVQMSAAFVRGLAWPFHPGTPGMDQQVAWAN